MFFLQLTLLQYVIGYYFDWERMKTFLNAENFDDTRIDYVINETLEFIDRDEHPTCHGKQIDVEDRGRLVITLSKDSWDCDPEKLKRKLKRKELKVQKVLEELGEHYLSGPHLFQWVD